MIYKIKTGASTKEDVLSFLGTPFGKNTRPDGTSMWSYQFIAVSNQSTAMALIPVVGPLMDAFEGQHMERTTQNLTVTFNKPGIVTACTYKTSSRKSEGGLGMMGNGGETVEMRCEDAK
jgi:outer membrane protein assembly factor BamE (lipoprotein component of BamABCDE complex)